MNTGRLAGRGAGLAVALVLAEPSSTWRSSARPELPDGETRVVHHRRGGLGPEGRDALRAEFSADAGGVMFGADYRVVPWLTAGLALS